MKGNPILIFSDENPELEPMMEGEIENEKGQDR